MYFLYKNPYIYVLTYALFVKTHDDPVESLEKTKDVPVDGLVVEYVEPHGFKK